MTSRLTILALVLCGLTSLGLAQSNGKITPGDPIDFWMYLRGTSQAVVDFGDGTPTETTTAKAGTLTHRYKASGLYVVTVRSDSGHPIAMTRVHVERRKLGPTQP